MHGKDTAKAVTPKANRVVMDAAVSSDKTLLPPAIFNEIMHSLIATAQLEPNAHNEAKRAAWRKTSDIFPFLAAS